jgi:rhodanese-related sulfurtransferase
MPAPASQAHYGNTTSSYIILKYLRMLRSLAAPFTVLFLLAMLSSLSRAFVSKSTFVVAHSTRAPLFTQPERHNNNNMSALQQERKAGVASPEELKEFVAKAGNRLLVVDVRNPDASVEPGDQKSLAVAVVPSEGVRPQAVHLIYDRNTKSMPLPNVDKDTPIITHCGGGGRGQKAKDYLLAAGFTHVLNGGGPKESDCWAEFGEK